MKKWIVGALFVSALSMQPLGVAAREIPNKQTVHTVESYTAELNRLIENNHYEQATQRLYIDASQADAIQQVFSKTSYTNATLSEDVLKQLNATGNSVRTTVMDTNDEAVQSITFSYLALDTFEEREAAKEQLDTIARTIYTTERPQTTYAVVEAINRYIATNYSYSFTPPNNKSPYVLSHFLQTTQGVCQAYASLASELLSRFGIQNKVVEGTVSFGPNHVEGHVWIAYEMDGEWYHFDPTWNDLDGIVSYREDFLALPTSALLQHDYARTMYIAIPEAKKAVVTTIPYSAANFSQAMTAYHAQQWADYLNHYWATFQTDYNTIDMQAMHVDAQHTYTLIIEDSGKTSMDIDGTIVEVNAIPAAKVARIILPINGYMKGSTRYIPVTKETMSIALRDTAAFTDIDTSYAKSMIEWLYEQQYIKGTTATTFSPKATLTKGHVVGIMGRYLGYEDGEVKTHPVFGRHWATNHYEKLQQQGIIPSTQQHFAGYAPITRVEMAQLVIALVKQQGISMTTNAPHFADRATFKNETDYQAALTLRSMGIADGNQYNHFNPYETLTREQFAKIFYNALQQ